MKKDSRWFRLGFGPALGVLVGGGYGLVLRFLAGFQDGAHSVVVMSLAFIAFGSLAIGYLTVAVARVSGGLRVALPPLSILLTVGMTYLAGKEGSICIVMGLPIMLIFGSIGGFLAPVRGGSSGLRLAAVLLAPIVGAPVETRFAPPLAHRTVETAIRIAAPPAVVWRNIERVRPIGRSELRDTWAQRVGFPRPVEATLSREGVGGVRHATFERGLLFVETVTRWEPERRLQFGIRADTENIPPTTLDEHVRIGGRYFDVLDGEYRIEPLPAGGVVLHLQSRERVSTDFNWYAGWWSDRVMGALQGSILEVIRDRCEAEAGS